MTFNKDKCLIILIIVLSKIYKHFSLFFMQGKQRFYLLPLAWCETFVYYLFTDYYGMDLVPVLNSQHIALYHKKVRMTPCVYLFS